MLWCFVASSISCSTNSADSRCPDSQLSSTDRDVASCYTRAGNDKITTLKTIIPHTSELSSLHEQTFHNANKATETKANNITDNITTKYSSPVDPQSNEESQGNINKITTPHSTPVDANDQMTKPGKQIDHNDVGYGEQDTPATITTKANNPELFTTTLPQEVHSIGDTTYTEELGAPHNHTKSLLTIKPPVLPAAESTKDTIIPPPDNAISKDAVASIVSSDEDENDSVAVNDRKQQRRHQHRHHKEEQIAVLPEDQDGAAVQVIQTPTPTQPINGRLYTGINRSNLPPSSDHTTVHVLWVHPQSPLVCV